MEALRTLVRELAVIAILFVVLELLLPAGDIRRYVRVVLGMVVIIAVLHAFTSFGWRSLDRELVNLRVERAGVSGEDALAKGQKLWEANQAHALAAYSEGLAKQIQALGRLSGEVEVAGARVVMEREGQIKEVVMVVERSRVRDREVAVWQPQDNQADEAVKRLRQTIADFYNLRLAQVRVVYR